jgi:hypothetical protein
MAYGLEGSTMVASGEIEKATVESTTPACHASKLKQKSAIDIGVSNDEGGVDWGEAAF